MFKKLVVCECSGVDLGIGTAAEREAGSLRETKDGSEVITW